MNGIEFTATMRWKPFGPPARIAKARHERCGYPDFTAQKNAVMSALAHVWTASWQELSDIAAALVGCGHVSGLFVRPGVGASKRCFPRRSS
jgi:hypothetical protein